MKQSFENIDNIFKDGLEDYKHIPSSGLWSRISGKLLRKELVNFNFTNIPGGWFSVAATGIIVASLTIFLFSPFTKEKLPVEKEILQKTENSLKPEKEKSDQIQLSEPEPVDNITIQVTDENIAQDNIGFQPDININEDIIPEISSSEFEVQNDRNVEFIEEVTQTNEIRTDDDEINTETALPVLPETVAIVEIPDADVKDAGLNENDRIESEKPKPENVINISELKNLSAKDAQVQDVSLKSDKLTKIPESDKKDILLTENESNAENSRKSGKIQKMHSLSFNFGKFFKGKYKPPKRHFQDEKYNYRAGKPFFTLSAYFGPEFTEYTRTTSKSWETNLLGGIGISYQSTMFLIQSGIEISYSNDVGDYMVNMQTYDSIGYFYDIGSFIIDPNDPNSIIFQTEIISVFDSIQHENYQQTKNNYTYLQIPLSVGYKAMESGRFAAYIKAGVSLSVLLNKKEQELNYYNPNATINYIDNYTPSRIKTSVQALISASFMFQATDNFGILLEPTYRYYIRSVYDHNGKSLKNPYSIGFKGGVYFNF